MTRKKQVAAAKRACGYLALAEKHALSPRSTAPKRARRNGSAKLVGRWTEHHNVPTSILVEYVYQESN